VPYIITTRHPRRTVWEGTRSKVVTEPPPTRTAVATLEEARDRVHEAIRHHDGSYTLAVMNQMGAVFGDNPFRTPDHTDGGTIGPLPNGTVIEVHEMSYEDIDAIPDGPQLLADGDSAELIAAFNGTHA
jgi:hypothetical protein